MSLLSSLILLLVLLFFSGFFSGAETAIFSLSKIERRRIKNKHPFIGTTVDYLLDHPRRTLITILIGNMMVNTMAIAIATYFAIALLGIAGVSIIIVIFTLILLFVGEILPKVFAIRNNTLIAEFSAVPLNWFAKLIFPLRWIVRQITDYVLSFLVKEKLKGADRLSEQELRTLAQIGKEEGVLKAKEEQMIARLLDLGNRSVDEIMTPKTEFIAFDINDHPDKLVDLIQRSHFSFIPIYQDTLDNFLGVLSTQEYMLNLPKKIQDLIRTPYYIPETKPIDELLEEFRLKSERFAVCVDEHGGIAGLVTLEDVVEEIFGEFYDEYAKVEELVTEKGSHELVVQAKISLHDLNQKLSCTLRSESSETLSGWILERLGKIPAINESFDYKDCHFQVLEVTKRRIVRVSIRRKI
ncbi:MAG: hypothetical protein COV74_08895 [Candidatus Omnitrophica bacterium CG11_big_fil_rev_8_21_14_0_20_45_26]|uniref:Hemolysin n=1 Tax=Candidatus Abzuiibacterium crystallinum TaxID=1974748 RepID=A0A2H0LLY2_9BACT|nr:MAG: hypothetical protein COV74_08895 [Candidatus Omnitrophica bacterium CG11_big_fil_rev_8_21_14_0_20_45_26]PIW64433.1 MAG: hypothetical protein COW12_06240 [Candidatus Omnitrophica bacterium CG12_big_fil_rev_8_21_14_0_65_45_16]